MELLLIPFLFLTGITLLVMSGNGLPIAAWPVLSDNISRLPQDRRPSTRLPQSGGSKAPAPTTRRPAVVADFDHTDAMLAELITEMIEFRRELAEVRAQVEGLVDRAGRKQPAAASRKRKAAS